VGRDEEVLAFPSVAALEAWFAEHHASSAGFWLKIRKKERGVDALDYAQALEVAICYGWIDGQKGRFDDEYWLQRFTPRRARSKWSKINRERADTLVEQGRMRPPGLAEVERAQADGRWDAAYAGSRTAEVPEDLAAALRDNPAAAAFFATLDSQNRYAIIYRVGDARKPETRARRIDRYVTMLAAHQKLHP
jgi:uncharacterized protein YdeI (YjbR/CyaY-like superfamily)